MRCCAVSLFALVLVTGARAFTVDCNAEYADCDNELKKALVDTERIQEPAEKQEHDTTTVVPTSPPTESTTSVTQPKERSLSYNTIPKPRLLHLLEDVPSEGITNKTVIPMKTDLSDVNLDSDDDRSPEDHEDTHHRKLIPDSFFSNLQAPFHSSLNQEEARFEAVECKDQNEVYLIGERIERGCEESCECMATGLLECSPRCKHPYIRRGRKLNDPMCFESPVDDCCSIVACTTHNAGENRGDSEVCRQGNQTYSLGTKWNIGCERVCSCGPGGSIECNPRCKILPQKENCINVQDPKDTCCEIQVCDVSHDDHEEPSDTLSKTMMDYNTVPMTTIPSPTTMAMEDSKTLEELLRFTSQGILSPSILKAPEDQDPYVEQQVRVHNISEDSPMMVSLNMTPKMPNVYNNTIGSIKVLQNNSVQVNLMHVNESTEPVDLMLSSDGGKTFKNIELNESNLLLNLQGGKDYIVKAKETGTNFNFTITAAEKDSKKEKGEESYTGKEGCTHDNKQYAAGEEFHKGCSELCECTAPGVTECVPLVCPSHVGIELMSKSCVKWAPNPPAQPPNCCPRVARCLSDGTCNYQGTPIPNWSEVPISMTGCEKRCFCENGDLDCQDVCSPLPSVPPQSLRCPPGFKPAPVNITEEDCCKQWGCIPKVQDTTGAGEIGSIHTTLNTTPLVVVNDSATSAINKSMHPPHPTMPLILKTSFKKPLETTTTTVSDLSISSQQDENITVFTLDDYNSPIKTIYPDKILAGFQNKVKQLPIVPSPILRTSDSEQIRSGVEDFAKWFEYQRLSDKQQKPKQQFTPDLPEFYTKIHSKHLEPMKNVFKTYHDYQGQLIKKVVTPSSKKEYHIEVPTPAPTKDPNYQYNNLFEPFPYLNAIDNIANKFNPKKKPEHPFQTERSSSKNVSSLRSTDVKLIIPVNNFNEENSWSANLKTILPINPQELTYTGIKPIKIAPFSHGRKSHKRVTNMQNLDTFDNLELLSQLDGESGVNRNLGRSADNFEVTNMGEHAAHMPDSPSLPHPPFLPTIPPEIHFPDEDKPDYNNNNINRPPGVILDTTASALPPGLHVPPNYRPENRKLSVITIHADSPTSVKMLFGLPPVLVGLRGSVDLRYTDNVDDDVSKWYSQVFAPADEILSTPRLEFRLTGLKPSTVYKVRGKLYLHNLAVEPESDVYSIRTLDLPTVTLPIEEKRREIDTSLTVMDSNDTSAHISWRHFTEEELQLIDGIQVRYRPVGTPIYSMTELLHHSRSNAELHDLRPGSRYEASLVLVPPPKATTELHDPGRVEFNTLPYIDPYNWTVTIEARAVGSEAAELTWHGVPSPAERWVRVYRAAHACGGVRKEHDAFRLATRDVPPTLTLTNLEPKMRCRVWLELFLTNGKVKTSNVLEINTKALNSGEPVDNTIEASSIAGSRTTNRSDYYGALVVVGVVAALGALTSLLLLLVVLRRHRPRSVPITPVPNAPRESSLPPYDNPAYKLELQQETVDL